MKFIRLVALIFLFTVFASTENAFANADLTGLFKPADADRILLIGFPDQSINRVQGASLSTSYRRRGTYQSSTWSRRISDQIAEDYHLQKLTEWPMTEVGVHCVVYRVPEAISVEDAIQRLGQDDRVKIVQKLQQFKTKAHHYNDPYYQLQSNLQMMQIDLAHIKSTGRNVAIAMIDTGVDINHSDLLGQISQNENFAADVSSSFALDMHGTAVAGIMVARKDNDTGIIGVAPDAKLIALKACWPDRPDSIEAICNSFTLALAVNTAIKSGANILNMSLAGPQDPILEILLNKAIEKGIIVVAADPGSESKERFPASLNNVIPVQTAQQTGAQLSISEVISAPGLNILTTMPHGTYDFISGSSLAAAQVSGIVALLLELKPDLKASEIKKALQQAGQPSQNQVNFQINANTAVLDICQNSVC
ncbi:MAG: S8 family peptidase [Methylococcaceae bacterium]